MFVKYIVRECIASKTIQTRIFNGNACFKIPCMYVNRSSQTVVHCEITETFSSKSTNLFILSWVLRIKLLSKKAQTVSTKLIISMQNSISFNII